MDTEHIDTYLTLVFSTQDKAEIARRILGSPTLSCVRDAYNDYEKFCNARMIKTVPVHRFLLHICEEYSLGYKSASKVNEFGNTVMYTTFCEAE